MLRKAAHHMQGQAYMLSPPFTCMLCVQRRAELARSHTNQAPTMQRYSLQKHTWIVTPRLACIMQELNTTGML
jgi:hypothetical protein